MACVERWLGGRLAADPPVTLTWIRPDGTTAWSSPLERSTEDLTRAAEIMRSGGAAAAARRLLDEALHLGASAAALAEPARSAEAATPGPPALTARDWHPPLPVHEVPTFEDAAISLAGLEGQVVLLDFWATWCAPCVEELPFVQSLWERYRDRGLAVVAVNAGESADVALPFARSLELTFPLARYGADFEQAFGIRSLPSLVIADRTGRIRARFHGYQRSHPEQVQRVVETLLDEKAPPRVVLAEVLDGAGFFEARWSRELPSAVQGVAVVPFAGQAPRIAVVAGRSAYLLDGEGKFLDTRDTPSSAGELRVSGTDAIAFHPAAREYVRLGWAADAAALAEATAPGALLDVAAACGSWYAGTLDGLVRLPAEGSGGTLLGRLGEVSDVAAGETDGRCEVRALSGGRRLVAVDPVSGSETSSVALPEGSWLALDGRGAPAGTAVAPWTVAGGAIGRFLDTGSSQIIVASRSGTMHVLASETGERLWRARWAETPRVAAADLDGDGRDELIVSVGRRISVLGTARSEARTD